MKSIKQSMYIKIFIGHNILGWYITPPKFSLKQGARKDGRGNEPVWLLRDV